MADNTTYKAPQRQCHQTCAVITVAISQNGVPHHHAIIGPNHATYIIPFLDPLQNRLTDNVPLNRDAFVRSWFTDDPLYIALNLPPTPSPISVSS